MIETQEQNTVAEAERIAPGILATVDSEATQTEALDAMSAQLAALEERVEALTTRLEALEQASSQRGSERRVEAGAAPAARKTLPAGVGTMLRRHGLAETEPGSIEAGSPLARVDAALTALPVEQRIAIKAELLRAGLL